MPFIKLQFKPGVNRDQTDYSNEGGWRECDKIRFRSGYPEKIGGWQKATSSQFQGVCRQMWNWVTTYSDNLMALGTHQKAYIENGGYYNNITPLRLVDPTLDTPDTDNCVYTDTVEPNVVTIQLPVAHLAETGDFVEISGVTGTIGGIPASQINGNHEITVVTGLAFTIPVTSTVTSSVITGAGGTSIILDFEIRPGYAITTAGYGWGTGTWSRGAWGLGSTEPIFFPQRDWWFDNFDNDLVMNIRNGAGYWWVRGTTPDPGTALSARAITLQKYAFDWATATSAPTYTPTEYAEAVPTKIMQLLVSQQDRHLIAFGAVPFGSTNPDDFDPMLIRWADQDTPEDWIPQPTNTAGDIRVSRGSRIVRALPSRQEILVWTDSHLFTLQFLGTTDVFGLQEYADNISIISSRAVTTAANITYWMGQDKFYAYTGRVETLPCTLRNHVFQNINISQADQVVCGTNEQWNEVWWFYPTNGSDYNNAYVVYNHLERIWYYGTIERTAWLDTALRRYPQGANTPLADFSMGQAYNHEDGIDDDADAMVSYIQSSDFDLADGDQFMLCRRIIPDVGFSGSTANDASVTMQIRSRNFPGSALSDNAVDSKPVIETSVDQYTDQVFLRARARQMALKIQSETLGVQWQLGAPRLDAREDGRR
jgi:hypothetical protein